MSLVVDLRDVGKQYPGNPGVTALRDVSLAIEPGEMLAIVGPSGSGKSTLLHIMGTLERASAGAVFIDGRAVAALADHELAAVRSRHIGFVFQQFFLLDHLSALENVAMGVLYRGTPADHRQLAAREALSKVGLTARARHRPNQLSGGERQRVAIARAIVGRPSIVFADEPTGNLDSKSGSDVLRVLQSLHADGTTIAVITHEREIADALPRRIELHDGQIVGDVHRAAA